MSTALKYGQQTSLDATFEEAVSKVTDALKAEGFGILTEINVQATLKTKLDVDMPEYVILGACNPGLAHQAMQEEQTVGLLLPCNVIVYRDENSEQTHVGILDPGLITQLTENSALSAVVSDAQARLGRVIEALES